MSSSVLIGTRSSTFCVKTPTYFFVELLKCSRHWRPPPRAGAHHAPMYSHCSTNRQPLYRPCATDTATSERVRSQSRPNNSPTR